MRQNRLIEEREREREDSPSTYVVIGLYFLLFLSETAEGVCACRGRTGQKNKICLQSTGVCLVASIIYGTATHNLSVFLQKRKYIKAQVNMPILKAKSVSKGGM